MDFTLNAKTRTIEGKKVKQLRQAGLIPAVLFGKNKPSQSLEIGDQEFQKTWGEAGEASLVNLKIDDSPAQPILFDEVQRHPVTGGVIHASLRRVDLKEKITTDIPLEFVGEAEAVKTGAGLLLTLLSEIEVECLPTDLPPHIEVDVTSLKVVGDTIFVKDLKIDRDKIEVKADPDEAVAKIDFAEMKEEPKEEVSEAEAIAAVEAAKEKAPEEGEEGEETEKAKEGEKKEEGKKE